MPDQELAMIAALGEAIEAAFPVLRQLEPGEPEQFLATTTLAHELEKRGVQLSLAPTPGSAAPPLTDLRQIGAAMAREEQAWQEGRVQGVREMASAVQTFLSKLVTGDYGLLPPELFREANILLANLTPKPRS